MASRLPNHDIYLLLLGGFKVCVNGRSVEGIDYNKMRALLAYLAVEREQDHRREFLAELLWSGNDPVTARGNLRRTLSDLRRVLELPTGNVLFSTRKDTIRFIPNVRVDVADFISQAPLGTQSDGAALTKAESTVDLYRGEFMAGFLLPDCPDFEDWLLMQRESLHRRALAALEQLSNFYESLEAYNKALPFALRYVELEPWDEGAHRRVMRLYALNGQVSAAIAQYEACGRLLKNELGIFPGKETQILANRICDGSLGRKPRDTTESASPPMLQPPAQWRQMSVLYCELEATATDDTEEALALMRQPQARCIEIIKGFSGHVAQMHGGGLLAYFGYPQAREDGAHRSVRAALAITREAVSGVEVRVGVHTGLIITGADPSMLDTVGKTSKIAIHMRRCIRDQDVAISQATHDIVAGYFDCDSLGVQSLPGSTQPLEVFRVKRESGARSRLEAATQLTPLTGRQAEIAQLLQLWSDAKRGTSHVALIQGEPGIGKSRLLHTLKQRLADQPYILRELNCFPEFSQIPFQTVLFTAEKTFDFSANDTPEMKSAKLAQHLERDYPELAGEAIPLLTSLCSLPATGNYPPLSLSPQKQKELTITMLLAMLLSRSARNPILLIVEDLHWCDPSTVELLTRLVTHQQPSAILAIFTARNEFSAPWDKGLTSPLAITPLVDSEMTDLVTSINADISPAIASRIVARSDGIPLFAEELTKIATRDNWASIPTTLRDLLAARVDDLGEAKYIAQLAASIGRDFDLTLLEKIATGSPQSLAQALHALQDAGLILTRGKTEYQFKHALIQEAAYQSQITVERQAAHKAIALTLQRNFPDLAMNQPAVLARHFSSGGEIRESIAYWIKAGQRANQGSANLEAIEHFRVALQFLMTLPATEERDKTEFTILNLLCAALYATQGYGSEEAGQVTARISALRDLAGDSPALFLAEWRRLRGAMAEGNSRGTAEDALKLLILAQGDPIKQQGAHHLCAVAFFWLGEYASARVHAEQAMALYQPDQHPRMMEFFAEDLSVSSAGYLSTSLNFLGLPGPAQQVCERMLERAREGQHPNTLAMALFYASVLHRWLNRHAETLRLSEEIITITRQHDMAFWVVTGQLFHTWARVMQGDSGDISAMETCIAHMRKAGRGRMVFLLAFLIEVYVHLRMHDKALALIMEAEADMAKTGDGHVAAELQRLKGLCLLALSPVDEEAAEACFAQALIISRRSGSKAMELRATLSMARLWLQQDRKDQARRLLEEIQNWFTENPETPDALESAELLHALA